MVLKIKNIKITALTSCCIDFFPEQNKIYVGGNSLNFATQCKKLGIDNVCIVGAVGNDKFGKLIEKHFDKEKINPEYLYRIQDENLIKGCSNRLRM